MKFLIWSNEVSLFVMARKKFRETVSEWSLQGGYPTGPLAVAFLRWHMENFSQQLVSPSNNSGLWNIWFTTSLPKRSRNSDRKRHKKIRIITQRITCHAMNLLLFMRHHMPLLCDAWEAITRRTTCERRESAYCVYLRSSLWIRRFPRMGH